MIINTFISDNLELEIPRYTKYSLEKIRQENPNEDILFISNTKPEYFDALKITWVPQNSVGNGSFLRQFNRLSWFNRHGTPNTSYPSPEGFWHKTCERIFYIIEFCRQNNLKQIWHFENDVLIYENLQKFQTTLNHAYAVEMSQSQTTLAISYFPSFKELEELGIFFIEAMQRGESFLQQKVNDHISEMSLLTLALYSGVIRSFPIFPGDEFVFDPGSYGQFLGGTNNFHGPGFIDNKHFVGRSIERNKISIKKIDSKFYVIDNEKNITSKLFNLHIHSKKLENFI